MLNGITNAAALCCQYSPDGSGSGITLNGGGASGGIVGGINIPAKPQGILEIIGAAIDRAVHSGDSGGGGGRSFGASQVVRGLNPVPFPMVNPFKPVVNTRSPVSGLNAWPEHIRVVPQADDGSEPDDEQSSLSGLGYGFGAETDTLGPVPPIPRLSTGGKLSTILGAIQTTLPATIQALRAQPANIYPYSPYTSNAGGSYPGYPGGEYVDSRPGTDIGARAGAAVGGVGDTVGSIVRDHPYLVMGGAAALLLLFMNPPRRR